MSRLILWSLLAAFLLLVGLWPAALAPVHLAAFGAAALIASIPSKVLALGAGALYLKFRHQPARPATA